VANLPVGGDNHELLISKTDDTPQYVTIAPPAGGQINGSTASIRLKVKGESVTLQNTGANDWWVVDDTRDNTPVGTIISYGSETPPPGYLPCDGSKLLRATQEDLFAAIGTTWGNPSATEFNLPALTGRLLRGSQTGLAVGVTQSDTMKNHRHAIQDKSHGHGVGGGTLSMSLGTREAKDDGANHLLGPAGDGAAIDVTPTPSLNILPSSSNLSVEAFGGKETRPDNAGVRYCIKY
jgi:microcystin-dependent protein